MLDLNLLKKEKRTLKTSRNLLYENVIFSIYDQLPIFFCFPKKKE